MICLKAKISKFFTLKFSHFHTKNYLEVALGNSCKVFKQIPPKMCSLFFGSRFSEF